MKLMKQELTLAILSIVALLASSFSAVAQNVDASEPESDDGRMEEILVTGTRLKRVSGADMAVPTTVIDVGEIQAAGRSELADVVNRIPSLFLTQTNQTSGMQENNGEVPGGAGVNSLDLRGLGVERTLTLVNGRRRVAGLPGTSAVDLTAISPLLVERVEVITGGASAQYGADAVAGVANIILKDDFDGIDTRVRYGDSIQGGMESYDADVMFGHNFANDRGNITASVHYSKRAEVLAGERDWFTKGEVYWVPDGQGGNNIAYPRYKLHANTHTTVALGGELYAFNDDGSIRPFNSGAQGVLDWQDQPIVPYNMMEWWFLYATEGSEAPTDWELYNLQVPLDRIGGRIAFNYDLTDNVTFFADIDYAEFESLSRGAPARSFFREVINGVENPFVTDEMRALNGGTLDAFTFSRLWKELSNSHQLTEREQYQATIGLEGTVGVFGNDWDWTVHYSNGESQQARSAQDRWIRFGPLGLEAVIDAVADPVTGQPICRVALTDPSTACVPVNPFLGSTEMPQEALDFLRHNTSPSRTTLDQQVFGGYMTGDLFELPAGAVQAAVGFEWRDEGVFVGAIPEFDPTSPKFVPEYERTEDILDGGYDVSEVFVETRVPLLSDKPFAQELAIEAAARWSDYSHAGTTTAWKFSGDWAPIQDIRIRSTYSRAVRAPNVNEAFVQGTESFAWQIDPCHHDELVQAEGAIPDDVYANRLANCASLNLYPSVPEGTGIGPDMNIDPRTSQAYIDNPYDFTDSRWFRPGLITSGNPDLKVEKADTFTAGVVLRPRALENFYLTVDYWDIDLQDSINAFGFGAILTKCVDSPDMNNPFCNSVVRDGDSVITQVTSQQLNVANFEIRGVDIEAHYTMDLDMFGKFGTLTFNPIFTRLLQRDFTTDPNFPDEVDETAGTIGGEYSAAPKWRGVLRSSVEFGRVRVDWTMRYMEGMRPFWADEPGDIPKDAPSVTYHDLFASVSIGENYTVYGGMNNMFDKAPPLYPDVYFGGIESSRRGSCGCSNYETNGATFYVGLQATF